MKLKISTILLLLISNFCFSQKPDTLIIKLNDDCCLNIYSDDLLDTYYQNFLLKDIFQNFYDNYIIFENKLDSSKSYLINCKLDGINIIDIKITENEPKKSEILIQDQNIFTFEEYNLTINFLQSDKTNNQVVINVTNKTKLSQILSIELDEIYNQAIEDIDNKNHSERRIFKAIYKNTSNYLDTENSYFLENKKSNTTFVSFNFGASLINSDIVPKIGFDFYFKLIKKNYLANCYGYSNNVYIFPSQTFFSDFYIFDVTNLTYTVLNIFNNTYTKFYGGVGLFMPNNLSIVYDYGIEFGYKNFSCSYNFMLKKRKNILFFDAMPFFCINFLF